MKELIQGIKEARFIWVCGNGGSAATAEHLTTDLVKKGYSAICLNSNTPLISMIANDYGYQHIFSKQLEVYAVDDDLLITISCSGTSPNIVKALEYAESMNLDCFKFKVFEGNRDFGLLEDEHLKFAHELAKEL